MAQAEVKTLKKYGAIWVTYHPEAVKASNVTINAVENHSSASLFLSFEEAVELVKTLRTCPEIEQASIPEVPNNANFLDESRINK